MLDRRAFLVAGGSSLAMFAHDAPLRAQGAAVRRRSVRGMSLNDPDLAAMRRAVARMKALPQSDPRNWIRFADIHRNFCPHANWYFLPWHRAYILAFERICQELSGKPDFALPYWNWTAERQFPAAFAAGDRNSNPLFHPRSGVTNGFSLADDMVGPAVMSEIMNSPDFEAFGSTRPLGQNSAAVSWQRRPGSATALEFNPHNGVHQAIGGNMAVIALSSRDPIFFLHHANVDRIWTAWNRRGNANSSDPMWRNFAFNRNFIDGDGSPWNVSVGQLGSPAALGYRYDDDEGPFAADLVLPAGDMMTEKLHAYRRIESRALSVAGNGGGLRRIELPTGGAIYAAAADNEQVASRGRPIGISVPLGRPLGDILGPQALAFRPDRPDARKYRRYVWAALRGIEPPLDPTTRLRVFVNCRELTPRTRLNDPSYSTSVSFFGGAHAGHDEAGTSPDGSSVYVDLTHALARIDHPRSLRNDRLTVQLLPSCSNSEANVSNVRPRRVEVVIL